MESECIQVVFYSLSKAFGVYYSRIGGVFCKQPIDELYDTLWYKNLLSIYIGTELLTAFGVRELPIKYKPMQDICLKHLYPWLQKNDITLHPSDVLMLLNGKMGANTQGAVKNNMLALERQPGQLRCCMTAFYAALQSLSKQVNAAQGEEVIQEKELVPENRMRSKL